MASIFHQLDDRRELVEVCPASTSEGCAPERMGRSRPVNSRCAGRSIGTCPLDGCRTESSCTHCRIQRNALARPGRCGSTRLVIRRTRVLPATRASSCYSGRWER
jgi:hypothetical protein